MNEDQQSVYAGKVHPRSRSLSPRSYLLRAMSQEHERTERGMSLCCIWATSEPTRSNVMVISPPRIVDQSGNRVDRLPTSIAHNAIRRL